MAINVPIVSTWNDRALKDAQRDVDGFASKLSAGFGRIGDAAKKVAIGLGAIGAAAAVGAGKAISAASDLAEAQSKTSVIFGESANAIEKFASMAATAYGQSKTEALNAASTFATFGKAAGLSGDQLVQFSADFVGLASDLASFNNTSPEEAVTAIGAALRGESEPLRRYGVLLNDAILKQKAFELGIYSGNGALTTQQKILAAERAIWEQTGDAQGDFARTSDGLANRQRILRAQLANVTTTIGTALLPIALKLATFIGEKVIPVIERLASVFQADGLSGVFRLAGDKLREVGPVWIAAAQDLLRRFGTWLVDVGLPALAQKAGELGVALWEWIQKVTPPALRALGRLIGRLAQWLVDVGLPALVEKAKRLGQAFVDWVKPLLPQILPKLAEMLAGILSWIVTDALPKLATTALEWLKALVGWAVELAPALIKGLGLALWELIKALPGLVWNLVVEGTKIGAQFAGAVMSEIGRIIGGLGSLIWEKIKTLFTMLVEIGKTIARKIIEGVTGVISGVGGAIWDGVKTAGSGVWGGVKAVIPGLATGGIAQSPTLAMIGDRRKSMGANPEAVVPLRSAGMGTVVNVNVSGALDPVATAKQIRLILQRDAARLGLSSAV
jgi:hypothetical protein